MGQEFGQEREWSEARELDWFLLEDSLNKGMHDYVGALLALYRSNRAMYEIDNDWGGFEWVNCDDADRSTYSFIRKSRDGKKKLLFVINMTPMLREQYAVGVPSGRKVKLVLNSDDERFGGNGHVIPDTIMPKPYECDNREYTLNFDLPPFSAVIFEL